MQHLARYRAVGGDEVQRGSHVRVYHSAALSHSAQSAYLAARGEFYRHLLRESIGSHYSLCRRVVARIAQSAYQLWHSLFYRLYRQLLTDNACGSHDDFLRLAAYALRRQLAHSECFLLAVRVAGVCVLRVRDDSLGLAARNGEVLFGNGNRRALYLVLGVYRSRAALGVRYYYREVVFLLVILLYPCIYAVSLEALGSANAAFYILVSVKAFESYVFHISSSPF